DRRQRERRRGVRGARRAGAGGREADGAGAQREPRRRRRGGGGDGDGGALMLAALVAASACGLLRPQEIAAVQGEAPREVRASEDRIGEFVVRRCFFVLPGFARSV